MTDSNGLEYTQKPDGTREYRIAEADRTKLPTNVLGGSTALLFSSDALAGTLMFRENAAAWVSI